MMVPLIKQYWFHSASAALLRKVLTWWIVKFT